MVGLRGKEVEEESSALGDSEPTPTPPRRGALSGPLLGGVGVGRFTVRESRIPSRERRVALDAERSALACFPLLWGDLPAVWQAGG